MENEPAAQVATEQEEKISIGIEAKRLGIYSKIQIILIVAQSIALEEKTVNREKDS